jgi:hypothetical protein
LSLATSSSMHACREVSRPTNRDINSSPVTTSRHRSPLTETSLSLADHTNALLVSSRSSQHPRLP